MVINPDNICILAISNVDMFNEVQTIIIGKLFYSQGILNTSNPMTEPNSLP